MSEEINDDHHAMMNGSRIAQRLQTEYIEYIESILAVYLELERTLEILAETYRIERKLEHAGCTYTDQLSHEAKTQTPPHSTRPAGSPEATRVQEPTPVEETQAQAT